MIFFTSDQHFGHANIIQYCKRPFGSVDEMDFEMIHQWNLTVGHSDTVYHLGDFCLGDSIAARRYFEHLKGNIKILGNHWHHDGRWLPPLYPSGIGCSDFCTALNAHVEILAPLVVLEFPKSDLLPLQWRVSQKDDKQQPQVIVLCHYPLAIWDRKHYGAWHLHGHSHGQHHGEGLLLDVGVDSMRFRPISLPEIAEKIRNLKCST